MSKVRDLILLFELEEGHLTQIPMLLHLVGEGPHYHGRCLAASTVLPKHLYDAVLERLIL